MPSTYRPRITRELRDRVLEVGEELNGAEPESYRESLEMLVRYLDVLQDRVTCPQCGEELEETATGKYRCWRCEQEGENAHFDLWDYLGTEDTEQAALPGFPREIQYRFECNHEEHSSGSKDEKNTQHAENQQGNTLETQHNPW